MYGDVTDMRPGLELSPWIVAWLYWELLMMDSEMLHVTAILSKIKLPPCCCCSMEVDPAGSTTRNDGG
jgi:hypothetical protein